MNLQNLFITTNFLYIVEHLNIVLTESALEILPDELKKNSKSYNLDHKFLDKSYHSHLMKNLDNIDKRGRPDIVHMSSLSITSTPLYLENQIKYYIHTISDHVIELDFGVRLPKSYHRFIGLFEKLFHNYLNNEESDPLINIYESSFSELMTDIDSDHVVGLSRQGDSLSSNYLSDKIINSSSPTLLIGGFSHGTFSKNVLTCIDDLISLGNFNLESHTACSRIIYEIEKHNPDFS